MLTALVGVLENSAASLSVTAGQQSFGSFPNAITSTGFISGAFGSRTPTSIKGLTVLECYDATGFADGAPVQSAAFALQSATDPGSTFLRSIAGIAIGSWSYIYSGTTARWSRGAVTFGFTNGVTTDVLIGF